MRNRSWGGDPPADDAEARDRIIGAAMRCIDRHGPNKTSLSDVATELGVTRQTVYRLFSSTEDLFQAVSVTAADAFVDQLAARVAGLTDLAEMLVECLAFTTERLSQERYLSLLLANGQITVPGQQFTSAIPSELTRALLSRLPFNWQRLRINRRQQDALIEIYLRTLHSFLTDPGPERAPKDLRAFIRSWIVPAVHDLIPASLSDATTGG